MSVTCKCRVHSIDPNTFCRNPQKIRPIDRSTRHYYRFFNICKLRQAILISIQSFYLMPEPHGSKQSCGQMAEEYKVSFRHKKPRLLTQVSPGSCFQSNLISLILTNQKKSKQDATQRFSDALKPLWEEFGLKFVRSTATTSVHLPCYPAGFPWEPKGRFAVRTLHTRGAK